MNHYILEHFRSYSTECPDAHYHQIRALHEDLSFTWQDAKALCPDLCRGWYELAHLAASDRVEFTKEFWATKFHLDPEFIKFLNSFFDRIDDIGIYLTQTIEDPFFKPHLVYSLKENEGFYRGASPITEEQTLQLQQLFSDSLLPNDYLHFLQIHNGFAKLLDSGVESSFQLKKVNLELRSLLAEREPLKTFKGALIDPNSLIAFYQSYHTPSFQCFYKEWYPKQEMGNLYYSAETHTISDYAKTDAETEAMAFETFTKWLKFYLEKLA